MNVAVCGEIQNMEVEMKHVENMKLHVKLVSVSSMIKEEINPDDENDYCEQISTNMNFHFHNLPDMIEEDTNVESFPIDDVDSNLMDVDEDEIIQDASGLLQPVLGMSLVKSYKNYKITIVLRTFEKRFF